MYRLFANIALAGISAAVPDNMVSVEDMLSRADKATAFTLKRVAMLAGLKRRYKAQENIYVGDLAYTAAESLMSRLGWQPESVSAFFFITHTPDYLTPATGDLLAGSLGFSEECVVTDIIDGCPGLLQGAMLACGLLNEKQPRAIIVAGSVYSKIIRGEDLGNSILFGDACGALALEWRPEAKPISFCQLSAPDVGFAIAHHGTGYRCARGKNRGLEMEGGAVMDFARKYVPACIRSHLALENLNLADINRFYIHQASKMILDRIASELGISKAKMPMIIADYANCSGATLAILACADKNNSMPGKTLFSAFGTGLRVYSMLADWDPHNAFDIERVPSGQSDFVRQLIRYNDLSLG